MQNILCIFLCFLPNSISSVHMPEDSLLLGEVLQYAIAVEIDDSGQVKSGARQTEQGRSRVKLSPLAVKNML